MTEIIKKALKPMAIKTLGEELEEKQRRIEELEKELEEEKETRMFWSKISGAHAEKLVKVKEALEGINNADELKAELEKIINF